MSVRIKGRRKEDQAMRERSGEVNMVQKKKKNEDKNEIKIKDRSEKKIKSKTQTSNVLSVFLNMSA